MKSLILVLFVFITGIKAIPAAAQQTTPKNTWTLTVGEAERILGEPAKVYEKKDSSAARGYVRRTLVYRTVAFEDKTGKEANLFYMLENFPDDSSPKKMYSEWKSGNQNHEGFEILKNVGDEGFLHSDKTNFATLIIRKGNKLLRLKINKLTSKSSQKELLKVAEEILARV